MAISDIKAKVGSVVFNKGKLPELLGNKINKFYDEMEKIIQTSMYELGEIIQEEIRLELKASTGSGRDYAYVDSKGNTLFEWTASLPGQLPASVSGKLADAIEFRVDLSGDHLGELVIGVWSNDKGGLYPTVAFYGKSNKQGESGVGKLVVGKGGNQSSLKDIAEWLEHGTEKMEPRPFLSPLFKQGVEKYKKEVRQMMRRALISAMGKSTLPVYFRFYLRENK